jgi:hypothetical protein
MNENDLVRDRVDSAVIHFFAQDLGRPRWVLAHHVPDRYGHCLGCHTQQTPTRFPCIVRRLAEDTLRRAVPTPRRPSE